MNTALKVDFLTPEEYLEGEERSDVKHEYIGGQVYAMPGTSQAHNRIALRLAATLLNRFGAGPCRVFMSDVKAHLEIAHQDLFYYPDVMVTCDPRDTEKYFCRHPKLVVEVLSESSEGADRREKLMNYIQMPSLETYLLLAQERIEATIFRRENNWRPEIITSPDQTLTIPSLSFSIPLRTIYEGVL
jgi:Uma2 family endonuclease